MERDLPQLTCFLDPVICVNSKYSTPISYFPSDIHDRLWKMIESKDILCDSAGSIIHSSGRVYFPNDSLKTQINTTEGIHFFNPNEIEIVETYIARIEQEKQILFNTLKSRFENDPEFFRIVPQKTRYFGLGLRHCYLSDYFTTSFEIYAKDPNSPIFVYLRNTFTMFGQ